MEYLTDEIKTIIKKLNQDENISSTELGILESTYVCLNIDHLLDKNEYKGIKTVQEKAIAYSRVLAEKDAEEYKNYLAYDGIITEVMENYKSLKLFTEETLYLYSALSNEMNIEIIKKINGNENTALNQYVSSAEILDEKGMYKAIIYNTRFTKYANKAVEIISDAYRIPAFNLYTMSTDYTKTAYEAYMRTRKALFSMSDEKEIADYSVLFPDKSPMNIHISNKAVNEATELLNIEKTQKPCFSRKFHSVFFKRLKKEG